MFAEGERVAVRVKYVSVEEVERIGEGLMIIPPEHPRIVIWVAGIGQRVAQVYRPRPRHRARQRKEEEEDQQLVKRRRALFHPQSSKPDLNSFRLSKQIERMFLRPRAVEVA